MPVKFIALRSLITVSLSQFQRVFMIKTLAYDSMNVNVLLPH